MEATELLIRQHREVEDLFDEFQTADAPEERLRIARTATLELRLHTTIEEELFYPAIREHAEGLADEVLEDLEEHHAVELLLDELDDLDSSDEAFDAKFTVVSELVTHHVQEEEDEQFPQVRDQLDAGLLEDLGERMERRYEQLKQEAEARGSSKEDLYQKARELGIDGRSRMSKRQLQQAVRNAG